MRARSPGRAAHREPEEADADARAPPPTVASSLYGTSMPMTEAACSSRASTTVVTACAAGTLKTVEESMPVATAAVPLSAPRDANVPPLFTMSP